MFESQIVVWDSAGSILATLIDHKGTVNSLKMIKDGLLASASDDKTIMIWDTTSFSLINTLSKHTDRVLDIDTIESKYYFILKLNALIKNKIKIKKE